MTLNVFAAASPPPTPDQNPSSAANTTTSSNATAAPTPAPTPDPVLQRIGLRTSLMSTLKSMSLEGATPLALQQRGASMQSVLSEPDELTAFAMDDATDTIEGIIGASSGENMASGTAEKLLGSIGFAMVGTQAQVLQAATQPPPSQPPIAPPPSYPPPPSCPPPSPPPPSEPSTILLDAALPQSEAPDSSTDVTTNSTNATDSTLAAARRRSSKLQNSTKSLTNTVLQARVKGEAPALISSDTASISAGVEDPCALEGKPFGGAPTSTSSAGGFTLPSGTLCTTVAG
eukprot:129821-Prymnesium_polylepis.2